MQILGMTLAILLLLSLRMCVLNPCRLSKKRTQKCCSQTQELVLKEFLLPVSNFLQLFTFMTKVTLKEPIFYKVSKDIEQQQTKSHSIKSQVRFFCSAISADYSNNKISSILKIKLLSGQFLKTPPYKSFSIMIIHIWPLKCLSDWCHSRLKLSVKKGQLKAKAMPAIAVFTVGKLQNCLKPNK